MAALGLPALERFTAAVVAMISSNTSLAAFLHRSCPWPQKYVYQRRKTSTRCSTTRLLYCAPHAGAELPRESHRSSIAWGSIHDSGRVQDLHTFRHWERPADCWSSRHHRLHEVQRSVIISRRIRGEVRHQVLDDSRWPARKRQGPTSTRRTNLQTFTSTSSPTREFQRDRMHDSFPLHCIINCRRMYITK